jgi:hypothetical protein
MTGFNPSTADKPRRMLRAWIVGAALAAGLAAAAACNRPANLDLKLSLRTEDNFFRLEMASGTTSLPLGTVREDDVHVR